MLGSQTWPCCREAGFPIPEDTQLVTGAPTAQPVPGLALVFSIVPRAYFPPTLVCVSTRHG